MWEKRGREKEEAWAWVRTDRWSEVGCDDRAREGALIGLCVQVIQIIQVIHIIQVILTLRLEALPLLFIRESDLTCCNNSLVTGDMLQELMSHV